MMHKVFFVQECPTCGRSLEIGVAHLGRHVYCRHCNARFLARPSDAPVRDAGEVDSLLRRAEQLIEEMPIRATRGWGIDPRS
jgi:hypothetical protein